MRSPRPHDASAEVGQVLVEIQRVEVHGPEAQLAKLRGGPLADLKPQYFTLEYGFRR